MKQPVNNQEYGRVGHMPTTQLTKEDQIMLDYFEQQEKASKQSILMWVIFAIISGMMTLGIFFWALSM